MIQAFESFKFHPTESPVSLILDGHTFSAVDAAGDCNAFFFEIHEFFKVGVVFAAGPNGGRVSIAFDKFALRISQSRETGPGDADEEDDRPPSHDTMATLLILKDLDDFEEGELEPAMGGVLATIGAAVQIIL
jgi:hypothetical protein